MDNADMHEVLLPQFKFTFKWAKLKWKAAKEINRFVIRANEEECFFVTKY